MKKLAAWRLWLESCALGTVLVSGGAHAALPEKVIATDDDVRRFDADTPFNFSEGALNVQTSFSTSRDMVLDDWAVVRVAPQVLFELNGTLSSPTVFGSPLEKLGAGTLRLAGRNTYSSLTALREGTLILAGDTPLGSAMPVLEQGTGTVLELEPGARVANPIELWEAWPEDQPLPGREGLVEWRVRDGVAFMDGQIGAQDIPVRKTGTGVLQLNQVFRGHGLGGYSDIWVDEGGLNVTATADAHVRVGAGAWLEGSGRVSALRVAPGGMVAPGGRQEVARLTVQGDARFEADSVFHVNVWPDGRADHLTVGGLASLDGTVLAAAGEGDWAAEQRYLILSAGDLGESRFAGAETDLAFLAPSLEYSDQQVWLALQRNGLTPGDVADDEEEEAVGNVITPPGPDPSPPEGPPERPDTPEEPPRPPVDPSVPAVPPVDQPGDGPVDPSPSEDPSAPAPEPPASEPAASEPAAEGAPTEGAPTEGGSPDPQPDPQPEPPDPPPLEVATQGMSVPEVRALLRQSTGHWHATLKHFLLDDGRHVRQAVLHGGRRQPDAPAAAGNAPRSWGQVWHSAGRFAPQGKGDADRYRRQGLALGLHHEVSPGWRVGPVLSAQWSELKRAGHQADASVRSLYGGVSADGDWNGMRVTAALLRAWHRVESRRRVEAGPLLSGLQRAGYLARSWQVALEVAPHLRSLAQWGVRLRETRASPWTMGPYARHEWTRLDVPGHVESGGPAAQGVFPSRTDLHVSTLGWRLRREWGGSAESSSWLDVAAGWRRIWGDGRVHGELHFPQGHAGLSFRSEGRPLLRHALALDVEAGLALRRDACLSLRYTGMRGSGQREHAAWAGFRWAF